MACCYTYFDIDIADNSKKPEAHQPVVDCQALNHDNHEDHQDIDIMSINTPHSHPPWCAKWLEIKASLAVFYMDDSHGNYMVYLLATSPISNVYEVFIHYSS